MATKGIGRVKNYEQGQEAQQSQGLKIGKENSSIFAK